MFVSWNYSGKEKNDKGNYFLTFGFIMEKIQI